MLNQRLLYSALFAYLSGATFVLQNIYPLSPQWYAAAFGLNSAGFMLFGHLAGRSAERWSIVGTPFVGIAVTALGATGLLAAGLTGVPLCVVIVALFSLAAGVTISSPPATTLALAGHPRTAGTAASLLGMVRFGFGAIAAPLVGVAGALSILPPGLVTTIAVLLAAASCLLLAPRSRASAPAPADAALTH